MNCKIDHKNFCSHASIIPFFLIVFLFFILILDLTTGNLFVLLYQLKVWQLGVFQYVQDAPAFDPSLVLQILHKHTIKQVLAPLLEHVVREAEAFRLETPTCQLLEKVGDHVRPWIVILVQDYVLELVEFNLTRFVIIDETEQEIDSLGRVDETKTNEWTVELLSRYRPVSIPV